MNKEALEKWADALEFGEYRQIYGDLRDWDPEGQEGFCALGVACDVYAQEHRLSRTSVAYEDLFEPDEGQIPEEVEGWLGITKDMQIEVIHLNDNNVMSLPALGTWVRDNLLKEE